MSGYLSNNVANSSIDLVVGTATAPQFSSITLAGANVVMAISGGVSGGTFRMLTASSLAPGSVWTPIATNVFDAGGRSIFTDVIAPAPSQRFYRVAQ